ncbi:MAG TPA: hypothetical protein VGF82_10260 [Terracidiphilus sp.]|jgi:drug/metabolite transporter (DMT)-like permease
MKRKWMPIGGLLLLSLLWAAGWVRADLFPGPGPGVKLGPLESEAAVLGVFAGLSGLALVRRSKWPGGRFAGRAVLAGLGLFVLPTILAESTRNWVGDSTRVAFFSLTPLFAIVFEPHLGIGNEKSQEARGLSAALLGAAGTLLIFPVEVPHSYASAFALAGLLCAAATAAAGNCVGVRIARECGSLATLSTVTCGSAAFLLGLLGLALHQKEAAGLKVDLWAIADLLALALLFWLMRRMSAPQMTTRFLIAPLIANVISLAFLRPHLEVQAWAGLLMITVGSGWMLFAGSGERAKTMLDLD